MDQKTTKILLAAIIAVAFIISCELSIRNMETVTNDSSLIIILLISPFICAIIAIIVSFFGKKNRHLRSLNNLVRLLFSLYIYVSLVAIFIYLYAWNRYPTLNYFEARFAFSATVFGSLMYTGNKLGFKNFDIRDMFFVDSFQLMEENETPATETEQGHTPNPMV